MKPNIRTILFDFDGVFCHDRFYVKTLLPKHRKTYDWIQENLFERNQDFVHRWMKGQITSSEVNRWIAEKTDIDCEQLVHLFSESVRLMVIDQELLELITQLRNKGIKIGLVTDNMDVFSTITITSHKLNERFDAIINSADYGFLKKDENGKLFDIALERVGESIEESLLVDNSATAIALFKQKGGQAYLYENFRVFEEWAQKNLMPDSVRQF